MNINAKLDLFRNLVQHKSLTDLKEQAGEQGIDALSHIAKACNRQDTEMLLRYVDRYLILASASLRAIEIKQAQLKPEVFNDIRDVIGPVLQEIVPADSSTKGQEEEKQKPSQFRIFGRQKPAK